MHGGGDARRRRCTEEAMLTNWRCNMWHYTAYLWHITGRPHEYSGSATPTILHHYLLLPPLPPLPPPPLLLLPRLLRARLSHRLSNSSEIAQLRNDGTPDALRGEGVRR